MHSVEFYSQAKGMNQELAIYDSTYEIGACKAFPVDAIMAWKN